MPQAETWALGERSVAVFSARSPGTDASNEDSAAVLDLDQDRHVLAVADGMGALPGGADASRVALEQLTGSVERGSAAGAGLRESILDGFEAANREVVGRGSGGGTTLAVVEVNGSQVRSYHVGDSTVMLVGQRGKLKHLTVAHSPVGYAVEAGMLDEDEALGHEDRHVISNMIGSAEMKIEVGPVLEMAPRDTLVIASDGLFDNLRLDDISTALRNGPLDRSVQQTIERCQRQMTTADADPPGKPDDLTLLVYRM